MICLSNDANLIFGNDCIDERGVNLPRFYDNPRGQTTVMIAYSTERKPVNTPGVVLGEYMTAERLSYTPNFMQRIWDTDLNKEVICVDEAKPLWVDALGNPVD